LSAAAIELGLVDELRTFGTGAPAMSRTLPTPLHWTKSGYPLCM
jgi:hypothetical protein